MTSLFTPSFLETIFWNSRCLQVIAFSAAFHNTSSSLTQCFTCFPRSLMRVWNKSGLSTNLPGLLLDTCSNLISHHLSLLSLLFFSQPVLGLTTESLWSLVKLTVWKCLQYWGQKTPISSLMGDLFMLPMTENVFSKTINYKILKIIFCKIKNMERNKVAN